MFRTSIIIAAAAFGIAEILGHYFTGQGVTELLETISTFQEVHNESDDVTPTISIWIDLPRIIFTPFFTMVKVNTYTNFDSLLIFGSFLHQAVMIFYFIGLIRMRK